MESLPRFKESGDIEREKVFGGPLKERVVNLCEQLKDKIDTGAYDILVSDDAGGRIPTLILREIIKQVHPEKTAEALFVGMGRESEIASDKIVSYLRKGLGGRKKVLLVTQIISFGSTVRRLASLLREAGADVVDVASVTGPTDIEMEMIERNMAKNREHSLDFYFGADYLDAMEDNPLEHRHEIVSGIARSERGRANQDPTPMRLDTLVDTEHARSRFLSEVERKEFIESVMKTLPSQPRTDQGEEMEVQQKQIKRREADEWEKTLQHRIKDAREELNRQPLSAEEKAAIQENINLSRERIKKLASEVVTEVWPELQKKISSESNV